MAAISQVTTISISSNSWRSLPDSAGCKSMYVNTLSSGVGTVMNLTLTWLPVLSAGTVHGITLNMTRYCLTPDITSDAGVRFLMSAGTSSRDYKKSEAWPRSSTETTYGGASDNWGISSVSDLASSVLAIYTSNSSNICHLDCLTLTVSWTAFPSTQSPTAASSTAPSTTAAATAAATTMSATTTRVKQVNESTGASEETVRPPSLSHSSSDANTVSSSTSANEQATETLSNQVKNNLEEVATPLQSDNKILVIGIVCGSIAFVISVLGIVVSAVFVIRKRSKNEEQVESAAPELPSAVSATMVLSGDTRYTMASLVSPEMAYNLGRSSSRGHLAYDKVPPLQGGAH
jgi:hypothetical protein